VAETITWYRGALEGDRSAIRERSLASIRAYEGSA
jgi:hypothetical protein